MTEQHRAYHNQWTYVRRQAELGHSDPSCILELLSRVEALEAGLRAIALPSSNRTHLGLTQDAPESSDSLMEEVVDAITDASAAYGTADEPARAAILAVADWFEQQDYHGTAEKLRMEVG